MTRPISQRNLKHSVDEPWNDNWMQGACWEARSQASYIDTSMDIDYILLWRQTRAKLCWMKGCATWPMWNAEETSEKIHSICTLLCFRPNRYLVLIWGYAWRIGKGEETQILVAKKYPRTGPWKDWLEITWMYEVRGYRLQWYCTKCNL